MPFFFYEIMKAVTICRSLRHSAFLFLKLYLCLTICIFGRIATFNFFFVLFATLQEITFLFWRDDQLLAWECFTRQILVEKHNFAPLWPQQPLLLLFTCFLLPCCIYNDTCVHMILCLFVHMSFSPAGMWATCKKGKFSKFISVPCARQNTWLNSVG